MTAPAGSKPFADLRRDAAMRLRAAWGEGVGTPDLDARLLLAEVWRETTARPDGEPEDLRPRPADIISWGSTDIPAGTATRIATRMETFVGRRLAGEPVDRILGRREFWSLSLRLSRETLSPRPDTETVVEAALTAVRASQNGPERAPKILDLGVGSGAILLALLAELPAATGVGVDRSEDAVRTARENARQLGFAARASFGVGDWGAAIGRGGFGLVVSNPPYIASATIESLAVEVRDHDPRAALDGGADGLDAYRAILPDLGRLLAPGGTAVLEVGAGQADLVSEMAAALGFAVTARNDLGGLPRVLVLNPRSGPAAAGPRPEAN